MNDDLMHNPPNDEPTLSGLRRDDFFDAPPAAEPPVEPPPAPPAAEPPAAPPSSGEPDRERIDEGSTGDLGRELPRGRPIEASPPLTEGLFGDDPKATEGWEARRMDRYERLPDQSPRVSRPRRSRTSRKQRKKKIWVRRLVALALLAALIFAVVAIVLAMTGGDDGAPSDKSGSGTNTGVTATPVPVYASTAGIPTVQKGADATRILNLVKQYSQPMHTRIAIYGNTAIVQAGKH